MSGADYKRITCAQCKAVFDSPRKKKYCSVQCNWRAKTLRRNHDAPTRQAKYARSCKHCGKGFKYSPAGKDKGHEHERGLFCCMACRVADYAPSKRPEYSVIYAGYCLGCGGAFVSKRKKQYCRRECWPDREWTSTAPSIKTCKGCGIAYSATGAKTRPSDYCGEECRNGATAAIKRTFRTKKRVAQRAVTVENVDPFKVFDRDRWRCQLCNAKTPKSKRGTYDDNAPELDHILPLSKGGEHSYLNTQCACRKCNRAKSSTPRGQMLLIG